ncbi:ABC-F family ATP-binding cassette domain-containing protein, partial [Actinotalea ferrariae]|uniref:ATP-binding cassette domain-containing protein n=1 Tax=Actinotalea ferrariae TaxID=1386098 RepID=UPI001C8B0AB2
MSALAPPSVVPAGAVHLVARDVAVGYPGRSVLTGVTFRAGPGSRVGLVGENGTGKTTLLRVLAGELQPTSGEVRRAGSLATVAQELEVAGDATVGDLVEEALAPVRAAAAELAAATAAMDALDAEAHPAVHD